MLCRHPIQRATVLTDPVSPNTVAPAVTPSLGLQLPEGLVKASRRPRLLVVDDQPINIQMLHRLFAQDCQVFMATQGEQAIQSCRANMPDLVLLDVMMPGIDGFEVCRRLKADPATAHIPVIFVTADSDQESTGLEAGAVDFIPKPFNQRVVRARVQTHLTLKFQSDLLRELVYTDGLTGVNNRRRFDEQFEVEWRRSTRTGQPLTLFMIDVDFFKRYNDHYGHQQGDDCLRQVAQCLRNSLKRPGDMVARYGGEEFACLLPETPWPHGLEMAASLERDIRALAIAHAQSTVAPHVSVSIGVAVRVSESQSSRESMLALADAHLYEAKHRGRGRASGARLP
jgi:diguanylate cyclase (GGDEF)-like protein